MDRSLNTIHLDTSQYLTVGRLLEKLQFEDVNNRIAICVENTEGNPPGLTTPLVAHPDGNFRDLFVKAAGQQ
jgi:hypothetical protein